MHILITNDDGPPSKTASPYLLTFVRTLEEAGHTVSVIVPDSQRSWIGKAHMVGQDVVATHYWPPATVPKVHSNTLSARDDTRYPWVLVNSTPAGAVQVGLNFFFQDRAPIDLVISGPNYGRNTSVVFALSSGTLGAALEAATCGYKAIALSFAFDDRTNKPEIVAQSCRQSVRVIEWLGKNAEWADARLYSVNVPLRDGVESRPVRWTRMLQNKWSRDACFQELSRAEAAKLRRGGSADVEEAKLRSQEGGVAALSATSQASSSAAAAAAASTATPAEDKWEERHFKWAPRFDAVHETVQKGGPGSDGWVVNEGETSITAIKANFMHVDGLEGELKL